MRIETGGPAFPRPASIDPTQGDLFDGNRLIEPHDGMTIRDWFAGRAMQGLVHDIIIDQPQEDALMKAGLVPEEFPGYLAHLAYAMADAMLVERVRPNHVKFTPLPKGQS